MARPSPVSRSGIRSEGVDIFRACLLGSAASLGLMFLAYFGAVALFDASARIVLRVNASYQETLAPSGVRSAAMAAREGR